MKSLAQFINESKTGFFTSIDDLKTSSQVLGFVDTLKTVYKKYKCKIEKIEVRRPFLEKRRVFTKFDKNKKYFFIQIETTGNKNSSVKSTLIRININDGNEIYKNSLVSLPTGKVEIYNGRSNNTVEYLIDGPNPVKYVYEIPEDLEWLYDYIKNA